MKKPLPTLAILFLLLAVLTSVAPTGARVPIGTLAGVVLNAHGRPVPNAAVTIQTSDGLQPYATHTDSAGHFQFTRLETGQYDLRASSGGKLSDWTKRVMVHANKITQVTLRLS